MRNYTLQFVVAYKKKLFTIVIFCLFSSISINAQNLLLNPGFESATVTTGFQSNYTLVTANGAGLPGEYVITSNASLMNTVAYAPIVAHSDSKMMVVDGTVNDIFWKQSPDIGLKAGDLYTFSFWVSNVNKSAANPPSILFTASGQCGCNPTLVSGSPSNIAAGWHQVVYTFTPTGTGTKYVRIELSTLFASPDGNDFAIDDLSLTAPDISLGIASPLYLTGHDNAIVAYPNPVDCILQITADSTVSNYRITSVVGAVVKEGKPINNSIDVSDLSSGLYFVQLQLENGEEHIQKIIKK